MHSSLFLFLHNLEEGNTAVIVNWAALAFSIGCKDHVRYYQPLREQSQHHNGHCDGTEFPRETPDRTRGRSSLGFFLGHLPAVGAMYSTVFQRAVYQHGTVFSACSWDIVAATEWKLDLQDYLTNCRTFLITKGTFWCYSLGLSLWWLWEHPGIPGNAPPARRLGVKSLYSV